MLGVEFPRFVMYVLLESKSGQLEVLWECLLSRIRIEGKGFVRVPAPSLFVHMRASFTPRMVKAGAFFHDVALDGLLVIIWCRSAWR